MKNKETKEKVVYILFSEYVNEQFGDEYKNFKVFDSEEKAYEAMHQEIGEDIHNMLIPKDWICETDKDSVEFYQEGYYIDCHASYRIKSAIVR